MRRVSWILWVGLLLTISWENPGSSAQEFTAKVVGVADGDTITVLQIELRCGCGLMGLTARRVAKRLAAGPRRLPPNSRSARCSRFAPVTRTVTEELLPRLCFLTVET